MFRTTNTLAILPVIFLGLSSVASAQLTVGAASELKPALEEIRRVYTERTGNPLRTLYADPAALVDRTSKGGIDVILLPAEWADSAKARNLSSQSPAFVAVSPMAVWSRQGRPLPDSQLLFLLDTTIHGIAISDPARSPDGARIRPSIEMLSADSAFRKRIILSSDPAAAIDSILADKADAAILPQSAFWSSAASGLGRQLLLDSTVIAPQRTMSLVMNVASDRQENARAFLSWALGPQGKGIWRRNGFFP